MSNLAKNFILLLLLSSALSPAGAIIKGGIDYHIPIDYTKLNQSELESKAETYYKTAIKSKTLNDDVTSALVLYSVLADKNPSNPYYSIRLGELYDKIGKDRLAKTSYFRASGLNQKSPAPYFYLGEFYYEREYYREALRYYKKAYFLGYSSNYYTLYKMGDIYEKFGDTKNALKYLRQASSIAPSDKLSKKINKLNTQNNSNKEYYR